MSSLGVGWGREHERSPKQSVLGIVEQCLARRPQSTPRSLQHLDTPSSLTPSIPAPSFHHRGCGASLASSHRPAYLDIRALRPLALLSSRPLVNALDVPCDDGVGVADEAVGAAERIEPQHATRKLIKRDHTALAAKKKDTSCMHMAS